MDKFADLGVSVIAGSADSLEDSRKAVDELGITYSLAYDVDVETISRVTGAYYEVYKKAKPLQGSQERKAEIKGEFRETESRFLQPTGFLIRPDKTIEVACYSSGHIGRLTAKDVGTLVKYLREQH